MLASYELERREAGLRTIMAVLNFSPDRSQLVRLAKMAQYPKLWWTFLYRWIFASSGAHPGNHMVCEGIYFGIRYRSNLIYKNYEQQGIEPVEDSPNFYHPVIVAGAHLPHVAFAPATNTYPHFPKSTAADDTIADDSCINDCVALDGYTLLVMDPNIEVVDKVVSMISSTPDGERGAVEGNILEDFTIKHRSVRQIEFFFRLRSIPLKIVYLRDRLERIASSDPFQQSVAKMYLDQHFVLARPDLFIAWHLKRNSVPHISILEFQKVAQICCCELVDYEQVKKAKIFARWLTQRFVDNIQGYKILHQEAIYVENQDKAEVLRILAAKKPKKEANTEGNKSGEESKDNTTPVASKEEGVDFSTLLTKDRKDPNSESKPVVALGDCPPY